jgi:hypothetical protein
MEAPEEQSGMADQGAMREQPAGAESGNGE